ncbi:hypothetical protein SLA2020_339380 [Shorea laevis]
MRSLLTPLWRGRRQLLFREVGIRPDVSWKWRYMLREVGEGWSCSLRTGRAGLEPCFWGAEQALAFFEAMNRFPSSDRGGGQGGVRRFDIGPVPLFAKVVRKAVPSTVMKRPDAYGLLVSIVSTRDLDLFPLGRQRSN